MIVDRVVNLLGIRSPWPRLVAGACLAALTVSLGTAAALWFLGMRAGAGLAGGLGAAAAAAYGVRVSNAGRT